MPAFVVRNEQFRDEVLKYAYPFDELSSLENEELYIGTDLFVDAMFYLKTPVELPLYISSVDGTVPGSAVFTISDSGTGIVGTATVSSETDAVTVHSPVGIPVGVLVFNAAGLIRFLGRVSGKVFTVLASVASFSPDVCHVSTVPYLRYITAAGTAVKGTVRIVARHGVTFRVADGRLSLNVHGNPAYAGNRQPVLSINGVRNRTIWLVGHPRANLRISNEDGKITFIAAKDATV